MTKKIKVIKVKTDINRVKLRGDWGKVKPVTRIEEDKTKFKRRTKHKADFKNTDGG